MKNKKSIFIKSSIMLFSVILSACSLPFLKDEPKTEKELISGFNKMIVNDLTKEVQTSIEKIKPKFQNNSFINIKALDINQHEMMKMTGNNVENFEFSLNVNSLTDESDIENIKNKVDIDLSVDVEGSEGEQNVSAFAEAKGTMQISDNTLWLYLDNASAESSLFPMSINPSRKILKKWFSIPLDKLLIQIEELSGIPITDNFDFNKYRKENTRTTIKKKIQKFISYLTTVELFKLQDRSNPEKIAMISEDEQFYIMNIELDKSIILGMLEDTIAFVKEQNKGQEMFIPEISIEDMPEVKGTLYVSVEDLNLFKFESTEVTIKGESVASFKISHLSPKKVDIEVIEKQSGMKAVFSKDDVKYHFELEDEFVLDAEFSDSKITINALVDEDEVFIVNLTKSDGLKYFSGEITFPKLEELSLIVKIKKFLISQEEAMLDFIINADGIDLGQITIGGIESYNDKIVIENPTENVKEIDLKELQQILMNGPFVENFQEGFNKGYQQKANDSERQAMIANISTILKISFVTEDIKKYNELHTIKKLNEAMIAQGYTLPKMKDDINIYYFATEEEFVVATCLSTNKLKGGSAGTSDFIAKIEFTDCTSEKGYVPRLSGDVEGVLSFPILK